jgi:hypothetical protein
MPGRSGIFFYPTKLREKSSTAAGAFFVIVEKFLPDVNTQTMVSGKAAMLPEWN